MFHVSTKLPYTEGDTQQVLKCDTPFVIHRVQSDMFPLGNLASCICMSFPSAQAAFRHLHNNPALLVNKNHSSLCYFSTFSPTFAAFLLSPPCLRYIQQLKMNHSSHTICCLSVFCGPSIDEVTSICSTSSASVGVKLAQSVSQYVWKRPLLETAPPGDASTNCTLRFLRVRSNKQKQENFLSKRFTASEINILPKARLYYYYISLFIVNYYHHSLENMANPFLLMFRKLKRFFEFFWFIEGNCDNLCLTNPLHFFPLKLKYYVWELQITNVCLKGGIFGLDSTTWNNSFLRVSVAEEETHRERHCCHRVPRWKHALCTRHDCLQLSPRLHRGANCQPVLERCSLQGNRCSFTARLGACATCL